MRVHRIRMMARTTAWRPPGLLLLCAALAPGGCTGGAPLAPPATLPPHNFNDPGYYVAPPAPAWTPTVAQAQAQVRAQPHSPKVYYWLGLAYYKQRDYPRAIAALERARRLAPGKALLYSALADVDTASGQPARALPVLQDLVRLPLPDPQARSDAFLSLGNSYWDLYRGAEAARAWQQSLRADPREADARLGLGLWAAHERRRDDARGDFVAALRDARTARTRAKAHAALGRLAEEGGDRAGARREYGEALREDAGNAWARAGLERLAGEAGPEFGS